MIDISKNVKCHCHGSFYPGSFFFIGLIAEKIKTVGKRSWGYTFLKIFLELKIPEKRSYQSTSKKEFLQNCDTPLEYSMVEENQQRPWKFHMCAHEFFCWHPRPLQILLLFYSLTDCWLLEFPMLFLQLPWKFYVLPTLPAPLAF